MHTALAAADACPNLGQFTSEPPPSLTSVRGELSGRPTCRIYLADSFWILQPDRASAWLADPIGPGTYKRFRTLGAAVRFADQHGLDYRIVKRRPLLITNVRRMGRR